MDLKRRLPILRWSVWRMAAGNRNITITGRIGDGREAAAVEYVLNNARPATSTTCWPPSTSSPTRNRS